MRDYEIELEVGDSLHMGDRVLTVVDIDDDEISFRLEVANSSEVETAGEPAGQRFRLSPR